MTKKKSMNAALDRALNSRDVKRCFIANGETFPLLHLCLGMPSFKKHVPLLLEEHPDVNMVTRPGKMTALHVASFASPVFVPALLEHGGSVEAVDAVGNTPLHFAVTSGDAVAVGALLDRGASVVQPNADGNTPLHLAAWKGNKQVMEALLTVVERPYLEIRSSSGMTPLMYAAAHWNADAAKVLLDAGADVRARMSKTRETVLHLATKCQRSPRGKKHGVRTLRVLLQGGADVHAVQSGSKATCLHTATTTGNVEAVNILLRAGADMRALAKGDLNATPLDLAKHHAELLAAYEKHADRCMTELVRDEEAAAAKKRASVETEEPPRAPPQEEEEEEEEVLVYGEGVWVEQRAEYYGLNLLVKLYGTRDEQKLQLYKAEARKWLQRAHSFVEHEDVYAMKHLRMYLH